MRYWSIDAIHEGILISYGIIDGATQTKFEEVTKGKVGRTIEEQIESRINSRINKKLDLGFCRTMEEAEKPKTNQLNLPRPMLAHRYDKVKQVDLVRSRCQMKLNGHRCLVTKVGGELLAYSRNGKIINSISHILDSLKDLPEDVTLDGELYIHGMPLQELGSLIRRTQAGSTELEYHVYDTISDEPFNQRMIEVIDLLIPVKNDKIVIVPTASTCLIPNITEYLSEVIDDGYEGLIIRQGNENLRSVLMMSLR